MGYMLLYVIQGSASVSGPYDRRGAHPPPHRHRPRVPAKLTHNHATGFPRRPCRGSLLGRALLWYPASRQWFDSDVSALVHTGCTWKSLVNYNVDYFFSINYVKLGGNCFEEGCENSVLSCYVCTGGIHEGEHDSVAGFGRQFDTKKRICIFKVSGNPRY